MKKSKLKIAEDFKEVFNLLENTDKNYFITGKAGTGKTTLLNHFRENSLKNIIVLAPTGIAAVSIGGSTIHSLFRFPPNLITKKDIKRIFGKDAMFDQIDCIVIDEVSMVRADVMDGIDQSLRINRGKSKKPFGGVQMIFFGDLYQLPPVVNDPVLEKYFTEQYKGSYFFNAKVFEENPLEKIEMQTIYRQKDVEFIELLNNIRNGKVSTDDLELLNSRVYPELNEIYDDSDEPIVVLTPINQKASYINNQRLSTLPGKEFHYGGSTTGTFDERSYPADADLVLKVGAQVIMLQNDIEDHRWQNGTVASISKLTDKKVWVEVDGVQYEVEPASWKKTEYIYNNAKEEIEMSERGSFKQFPLKLAWAITIHKSQGKTFDKVIIDIGHGAFASGQTYVALSRCRSLKGIYLSSPIRASDIKTDPKVINFLSPQ